VAGQSIINAKANCFLVDHGTFLDKLGFSAYKGYTNAKML